MRDNTGRFIAGGGLENLCGQQFGKLVVLDNYELRKRRTCWECRCECGNTCWVRKDKLKNGTTISCGCAMKRRNHNYANTKIYTRWRSMLTRCYNPNSAKYYAYGARGISVCERWHTFMLFYEDMGEAPEGLSLERVDNNGNYCPENTIWADSITQARNKRAHGEARREYEEILSNNSDTP